MYFFYFHGVFVLFRGSLFALSCDPDRCYHPVQSESGNNSNYEVLPRFSKSPISRSVARCSSSYNTAMTNKRKELFSLSINAKRKEENEIFQWRRKRVERKGKLDNRRWIHMSFNDHKSRTQPFHPCLDMFIPDSSCKPHHLICYWGLDVYRFEIIKYIGNRIKIN